MKITVPRDHTHAGVFYPAGSQVDLSESEIAWLMQAEGATRERLIAEVLPLSEPVEMEDVLDEASPTDLEEAPE